MKLLLTLLLIVNAFAGALTAQERFLKPVDEAADDPSFAAFRSKLIAAAEKRDSRYILSIVDPKIQNGFGDRNGIAWFKRDWKLDRHDSKFWPKFLWVIRNGGSFTGDGDKRLSSFAAPYVYTAWPDDVDSFEYFAITGSDVNVRKTPGMDGEVVAKLSYTIVKADMDDAVLDPSSLEPTLAPKEPNVFLWVKVTTLGGVTGFVKDEFVRSPIDYRAGFEKKGGRWVMTFFLAGD